jgi:hypothetical protein
MLYKVLLVSEEVFILNAKDDREAITRRINDLGLLIGGIPPSNSPSLARVPITLARPTNETLTAS